MSLVWILLWCKWRGTCPTLAAAELSASTSTASTETQQAHWYRIMAVHSTALRKPCTASPCRASLLGRLHKRVKVCQHSREACTHCTGSILPLGHLLLLTPSACWQGRWHISQKRVESRWWKALAAGRDNTSVNAWDARRSRLRTMV